MNRQQIETMSAIADRFLNIAPLHKKLDVMMDIEYTHESHPLDLEQLLAFPNGDFAHDMWGIYENFNRQTKQMDNCFSPRCSLPEGK